MSDLVPGVSYTTLVAAAVQYRTEPLFRASPFFNRHGADIEKLLTSPIVHRYEASRTAEFTDPGGSAKAGDIIDRRPGGAGATDRAGQRTDRRLDVVHWNIEKGKKLGGILEFLSRDPAMTGADVICLNEVDDGMARSGNADVTRELARGLGCDGVYLPNYIELTKGLPRERLVPGENKRGLHGTAILSRLPITDIRVEVLPACWDYFDYPEKRFGGRRGLYLKLDRDGAPVVVATTHLEMRCAPRCRARQFQAFLAGLGKCERDWGRSPVVLTGDWNTHTFRRGGRINSGIEFLRIIGTPRGRLDRDLVRPFHLEPLFKTLNHAGFTLASANDDSSTASQALDTVEDLALLPDWLGRGLVELSGLKGRILRMRLDWIAIRDLKATAPPRTLFPLGHDGEPLSDHALITAGVE